jgi:GNAT superfamily N-acetyltransferase
LSNLEYVLLNDNIDLSKLDFKDDNNKDTERLQWFIKNHAHKHHRGNFGLTYAFRYEGQYIGYITLATSTIQKKIVQTTAPATSHLPSIIVAYFAVDRPYRKGQRGISVGSEALLWLYGLARNIGHSVGCRYITLYAKNAVDFYQKKGFEQTEITTNDGFILMYKDLYPEKVEYN